MADSELDRAPGPHVLLVDDDADTRDMYAIYFAAVGFRVDRAENASEAMGHIATARPNVAVVDIALPRTDGIELCRIIRQQAGDRPPLLVAITGLSLGQSETARLRDAQVDALVYKPCLPDRLVAEVQHLLAQSARVHEASEALFRGVQGTTTASQRTVEEPLPLQDWARRPRRP